MEFLGKLEVLLGRLFRGRVLHSHKSEAPEAMTYFQIGKSLTSASIADELFGQLRSFEIVGNVVTM